MAEYAREFRLERTGRIGPLLFILVPAAIGIYILAIQGTKNNTVFIKNSATGQNASALNALFLDTDGDGLKNWEEDLYGTNPRNPDTDGDGISDRDETLDGTNQAVRADASTGKSENLTQTFISKLMNEEGLIALSHGKEGALVTSGLLAGELNRLSEEGALPRPIPAVLPGHMPITTTDDSSPDAAREYLNNAALIISRESRDLKKDNLDLLVEIMQSGDLARLSELTPYREAAQTIVRELTRLPVPKQLLWYHERLLYLMEQMAMQIQVFERTQEDPLKTLANVEPNIQVKEQLLILNRNDLFDWLNEKKIELRPEDAAYPIVY